MRMDMKQPCADCPFRIGNGEKFRLREERIAELETAATSFQCHKTVDYSDDELSPGNKPQECAGFMTLHHRSETWTQMMRIAERIGAMNCDDLDPKGEVYEDWDAVYAAHCR